MSLDTTNPVIPRSKKMKAGSNTLWTDVSDSIRAPCPSETVLSTLHAPSHVTFTTQWVACWSHFSKRRRLKPRSVFSSRARDINDGSSDQADVPHSYKALAWHVPLISNGLVSETHFSVVKPFCSGSVSWRVDVGIWTWSWWWQLCWWINCSHSPHLFCMI